jgi:hypothetical protein
MTKAQIIAAKNRTRAHVRKMLRLRQTTVAK